jgi:cellulose synthase/poly-beta-1,6-N-acetylglucosamine synthase-like glycosyltransferase
MIQNKQPIVTFALIAYNQEKYIREAVAGALSQTYTPLQIILSDDCSSDETLEIMKAMVSQYEGPHSVHVRKTNSNLGTLLHVSEIASVADGELIILAAGDDISKPARTEVMVQAWLDSGAWGLCSTFDRINEAGMLIGRDETLAILSSPQYSLRQYFSRNQDKVKIVHGATSAYDKRLFQFLVTRPDDYILSEDGALSVLLNLLNKNIKILSDSLVCYRENDQSLTNGSKSGPITFTTTLSDERAIERLARAQANRCQLFLRFQETYGATSNTPLDITRLQADFSRQTLCASWRQTSINQKIRYLLKIRSSAELKWYLPRIFPEPLFIAAKTLIKAVRQRFISPSKLDPHG